jgi:type I restriction enzyme S subunit
MSADPLPDGWTTATFGEILLGIEAGKSFRCEEREPGPDEIGVVKVSAVTWGEYDEAESKTCTTPALVNPHFFVRPGDFLFSRANTIELVGACVIASKVTRPVMLSDKILRLTVADENERWALWYLRSSDGRREIERLATGNQDSMRNIGQERIREIRMPLAPPEERNRIVEALDSYLSRLDESVALLERVQRNLKRYRASVLQAAVTGKLVPIEAELARAEGRDYEPASVLLERILAERRRRWAESGKKGKYEEPAAPDTTGLPELPEGWCWATVDQLSLEVKYGSSSKTNDDLTDGVPVIRMGNIQDGDVRYDVLKYLPVDHDEFPDLLLEPGDLLFNRTNSPELVGKSAIYRRAGSAYSFASYLIRVRFIVGVVPEFIAGFINSLDGRVWVGSVVVQQVGQANVNGSKLRACRIPLPPEREQARIVAELDRLVTVLNATEQSGRANLTRCARLRQSILKWAFEGKLADQDPADEPAADLLARIRADRAAAAAAPKAPARGRKKSP